MKKPTILFVFLAILGTSWGQVPQEKFQDKTPMDVYWERFRAAVATADSVAVAGLSQFPITMPYGVPTIRNQAQLRKRYRDVFDGEANAANCFPESRPEVNPDNSREFTVACKNAAGDEVIIYSFVRTRTGWKFRGLDNLNE